MALIFYAALVTLLHIDVVTCERHGILCLIVAALRSRCGHYILSRCFFYLLSIYLFLAHSQSLQTGCLPTILPHMVWPYCEFMMHVWNVLHAARWKCRKYAKYRQEFAICMSTIAQVCRAISSQLRHVSTIGIKLLNS